MRLDHLLSKEPLLIVTASDGPAVCGWSVGGAGLERYGIGTRHLAGAVPTCVGGVVLVVPPSWPGPLLVGLGGWGWRTVGVLGQHAPTFVGGPGA